MEAPTSPSYIIVLMVTARQARPSTIAVTDPFGGFGPVGLTGL